jgi:hypothetical protein
MVALCCAAALALLITIAARRCVLYIRDLRSRLKESDEKVSSTEAALSLHIRKYEDLLQSSATLSSSLEQAEQSREADADKWPALLSDEDLMFLWSAVIRAHNVLVDSSGPSDAIAQGNAICRTLGREVWRREVSTGGWAANAEHPMTVLE